MSNAPLDFVALAIRHLSDAGLLQMIRDAPEGGPLLAYARSELYRRMFEAAD